MLAGGFANILQLAWELNSTKRAAVDKEKNTTQQTFKEEI